MASGADAYVDVFVGTGSDLDFEKIGFSPRYVRVVNVTGNCTFEWFQTMADDSAFKQNGGTQSLVTTNGITPLSDGFSLGADADMNVSGEVLHVLALR
jgi:hypothetical protein